VKAAVYDRVHLRNPHCRDDPSAAVDLAKKRRDTNFLKPRPFGPNRHRAAASRAARRAADGRQREQRLVLRGDRRDSGYHSDEEAGAEQA